MLVKQLRTQSKEETKIASREDSLFHEVGQQRESEGD